MLTATTAVLLAATAAGAAGQIASGFAANQAAKAQAGQLEEQARIARQESETAATQKETERRKFLAEQRMAYLANGVDLSGTPGIVQADTFKEFQMEIDALRNSGVAKFGAYTREAATTRNSGRAAIVSGLLEGVGTLAMGAYQAGGLGGKTTSTMSKTAGTNNYKFRNTLMFP